MSNKKHTSIMLGIISLCPNCKPHPYQDTVYGKNRRLKNQLMIRQGRGVEYRCTCCEKVSSN